MLLLKLALVFIASFLFALALTPIVRKYAIRFGVTDDPDNHRKLHGRTVARAGGTAVLGAVLLVCAFALFQFDLTSLGKTCQCDGVCHGCGIDVGKALGVAGQTFCQRDLLRQGRRQIGAALVFASGL